jgi:hypothetical protein
MNMAFDIEKSIIHDGFVLDAETDNRSSYRKDGLWVNIHWAGRHEDHLGNGCYVSVNISDMKSELYTGILPPSVESYKALMEMIPRLQQTAITYPDLNIHWIFTGEGDMIKKN